MCSFTYNSSVLTETRETSWGKMNCCLQATYLKHCTNIVFVHMDSVDFCYRKGTEVHTTTAILPTVIQEECRTLSTRAITQHMETRWVWDSKKKMNGRVIILKSHSVFFLHFFFWRGVKFGLYIINLLLCILVKKCKQISVFRH